MENDIHDGLDVGSTLDYLNRLRNAEEGTWNGSSITSTMREQHWTLTDQAGNRDQVRLDLNGEGIVQRQGAGTTMTGPQRGGRDDGPGHGR